MNKPESNSNSKTTWLSMGHHPVRYHPWKANHGQKSPIEIQFFGTGPVLLVLIVSNDYCMIMYINWLMSHPIIAIDMIMHINWFHINYPPKIWLDSSIHVTTLWVNTVNTLTFKLLTKPWIYWLVRYKCVPKYEWASANFDPCVFDLTTHRTYFTSCPLLWCFPVCTVYI